MTKKTKKTTKRRFIALVASAIMAMSCVSTSIIAAEEDDDINVPIAEVVSVEELEGGITQTTYEFEVTPECIDENGYAMIGIGSRSIALDQTFTMTGTYHRGGDRKYSGNRMYYAVTVTGSDGSAVDKQIDVEMWDYNHSGYLRNMIADADGLTTMSPTFSITPNRYYYFKYYLAYSIDGTSNVRIRMVVNTWTE